MTCDDPVTRHRMFLIVHDGVTHQVRRPNFELGDALYFPDCIPAGWQVRPTIETDWPGGFEHACKPYLLLRSFPGLMTHREYVDLPIARRRRPQVHGNWVWRRLCRKDPSKAAFIAQIEQLHAKIVAEGAGWPEGTPAQWPAGSKTKWL